MSQPPSTRVATESMNRGRSVDDELASLPRPPRRMRTLSLAFMAVASIAAGVMAILLAGDARYALRTASPAEVGELAVLSPSKQLKNLFVQGSGQLDAKRALRYQRPLESDTFQLSPIVGNPKLWVELRAADDLSPSAHRPPPPPTVFVGRLVPLQEIGFRRSRARSGSGPSTVPADAWILLDGVTPQSLEWTIPLLALFVAFVLFCSITMLRIVMPVRR
jgi:hypothetical protein